MSNDTQKADSIAFHFYTKFFYVVNDARATAEPRVQPKLDKWFNLETPDSDLFTKESRDPYRAMSSSPPPPPLEIQVLLTIPELTNNQVLVYLAPDSSRIRVEPTPRHILLESWVLDFAPRDYEDDDGGEVALPTIYKHGIPLFRSLYSLLRILPTWKLYKRLRRRNGGASRAGSFNIQLRVRTDNSEDILDFAMPPSTHAPPLPTESHSFPAVPLTMGNLSLSTTYLTSPNFQLDELESLLSSRFLSLDEGPEFVPTLAKNQQRESMSGSPGSLPIRISLPKSPPSSIADKFVLPSRTASTSASGVGGSPRNTPPSATRFPTNAPGSTSGSIASSRQDSVTSAWSKDEATRPASGLAARLHKESLTRGADLPSAPSPLPIRRPNINPVHPFKSSTLSSGSPSLLSPSPSLRQASPLSSAGISSAGFSPAFPTRPTPHSPASSRVPPSPIGIGSRPSPPFAPSSLSDRRSLASAEGSSDDASPRVPVPTRKRYSSSFGHRYAPAGVGSEGSTGSGERREGERVGSASFLSTTTDDDDISAFVQDIDARKPLNGHAQAHDAAPSPADRERTMRPARAPGGSPPGPMLTNESDVDARLRRMNDAFVASLQGLGGGGSRRRERQRAESESAAPGVRTDAGLERAGGDGSGPGSTSASASGSGGDAGGGVGRLRAPGGGSGSTSVSEGVSQGSQEVMGRMEMDSDQRRRGLR